MIAQAKKLWTLFILLLLIIAMPNGLYSAPKPQLIKSMPHAFAVNTKSRNGFWTKAQEFQGFGCTGRNVSPVLQWTSGPIGTKSYAITIDDPDAPTGSGWWHWTLVNIPANVHHLSEGGPLPAGSIQGRNDYGVAEFGGACPPQGDKPHRYVISVWALKVSKLDNVDAQSSGALVGFMLNQHKLAKAVTIVKYGR